MSTLIFYIVWVIALYTIAGVILLNSKIITRISLYNIYVKKSEWFGVSAIIWLYAWPYTLWFFTNKKVIKEIGLAKHRAHSWVYDIEGNEYPKDMQDKLLRQQIEEEIAGEGK